MFSKDNLLVLFCASIGGILGHLAFLWIARQGFYALILPGALLGFGASLFMSTSKAVHCICGFLALALGLYTEWSFAPFVADKSFPYFLSHAHQLKPITLIMIAVGALLGFWIPRGRVRAASVGPEL